MIVGKGIAKRDRRSLAHDMIAGRDQHEAVFCKRKGFQFLGGVDLVSDDADLGGVPGDGAHDVTAGALLQIDVDQGMLRHKRG
jgi:hypothetical protein